MAINSISQYVLVTLLDYSKDTGDFYWKRSIGAAKQGKKAGYICNRHIQIRIQTKLYYAHRLAWIYVYGTDPVEVDHINGNPTDNRIANLRSVDHRTNMENLRSAQSHNKSGYLGVETIERKNGKISYRASIIVNGKRFELGKFDCPKEAHENYIAAKRLNHSGCTI